MEATYRTRHWTLQLHGAMQLKALSRIWCAVCDRCDERGTVYQNVNVAESSTGHVAVCLPCWATITAPTPTPGAPLAAPTSSPDAPCPDCGAHPPHNQPATEIDCDCGVTGCRCDPQTPAARDLPAYNPEDGAPCAQCGHGQELHVNGTEDCWESTDATPATFCPCPRFQTREAAQRADEAELPCPDCGKLDGAHTYNCATSWGWETSAPAPMAGGSEEAYCTDTRHCICPCHPGRCPPCRRGAELSAATAGPLCADCRPPGTVAAFEIGPRDGITIERYPRHRPPMAGGAPSHYTDPAWLADEAWALQAERNAESAQEETEDEPLLATLPNGQEIRGTVQPDGKVHVTHWPAATVTSTHRHGIMGAILEALDPERYAREFPDAPHTHPCPTCRALRPCTGTGCADGPRECSTCSNCRGW